MSDPKKKPIEQLLRDAADRILEQSKTWGILHRNSGERDLALGQRIIQMECEAFACARVAEFIESLRKNDGYPPKT